MVRKKGVVLLLVVVVATVLLLRAEPAGAEETDYLNEWVAEIEGGLIHARSVAERHGFELEGPMSTIADHYILRHKDVPNRAKRSADHHTTRLAEDKEVKWVEQQFARPRSKRGYESDLMKLYLDYLPRDNIDLNQTLMYNDPDFVYQWYIVGDKSSGEYMGNIQEVWKKNITGAGVVVCVVDDGLERNHTDLVDNYDPFASWDANDPNDTDSDPMPRYDLTNENKHGTRCAGEIGMLANNSFCGVGVAYNCNIGGIRLLDGNVTDKLEAESLSFNHTYIDIYSLSWGPTDDGKTLDKPHKLAQLAMETAIKFGRGGKGVIFVLASGNGGGAEDNCNCDGYAASLYTISVSSASNEGTKPFYGELCPSTLTTTYSSGGGGIGVTTTDLRDECTHHHSGTSASAPLASGVIALVLEANPDLTWRDVQHLVVITSKPHQLAKEDWYKNAAGFCVNPAFGFGLMDALDMVTRAQNWELVPEQRVCNTTLSSKTKRSVLPRQIVNGTGAEVTIKTDGCKGQDNEIKYLEHVQFIFTMNYTRRGAFSTYTISPKGTKTILLRPRSRDNSTDDFDHWPLMSVHTWGEDPRGTWTFGVEPKVDDTCENHGTLLDVKIILYGTATAPAYRNDDSVYCNMTLLASNQTETKTTEEDDKQDDNQNSMNSTVTKTNETENSSDEKP